MARMRTWIYKNGDYQPATRLETIGINSAHARRWPRRRARWSKRANDAVRGTISMSAREKPVVTVVDKVVSVLLTGGI